MSKLKSLNFLIKFSKEKKISGKKIVLCHGVFDFPHLGHIKHFKAAKSLVTDINKEAIYIAKKNAILNGTVNQMRFICCDWLNCFDNLNFDILISNPPYIERQELSNLEKSVKDFDPKIALDGGIDGLNHYRNTT